MNLAVRIRHRFLDHAGLLLDCGWLVCQVLNSVLQGFGFGSKRTESTANARVYYGAVFADWEIYSYSSHPGQPHPSRTSISMQSLGLKLAFVEIVESCTLMLLPSS